MKPLISRLFTAALLLSPLAPVRAASDAETNAHRAALELAGAFSNDGFKIRDGLWTGTIRPGKPQVVQVNLYAGNQYWFSVGAPSVKKVTLSVYDESGAPVPFEPYADGSTAAAGVAPKTSGPYYIKLEEPSGAAATFCLIYSYK